MSEQALVQKALSPFDLGALQTPLGSGTYNKVFPHPNFPNDLVVRLPHEAIPNLSKSKVSPSRRLVQFPDLEIGEARSHFYDNGYRGDIIKRYPGESLTNLDHLHHELARRSNQGKTIDYLQTLASVPEESFVDLRKTLKEVGTRNVQYPITYDAHAGNIIFDKKTQRFVPIDFFDELNPETRWGAMNPLRKDAIMSGYITGESPSLMEHTIRAAEKNPNIPRPVIQTSKQLLDQIFRKIKAAGKAVPAMIPFGASIGGGAGGVSPQIGQTANTVLDQGFTMPNTDFRSTGSNRHGHKLAAQ